MDKFFRDRSTSSSGESRQNMTHQHYESSETVTTHRSQSVTSFSRSYSGSGGVNLSVPFNREAPKWPPLTIHPFNTQIDAKPLSLPPKKINMNYESPYKRQSPVYRSLGAYSTTSKPSSSISNNVTKCVASTPHLSGANKKISVVATGQLYDHQSDPVPVYKTSSKNRGEVLIINNILFPNSEYRAGAELDEVNLDELFKQIGFNVKLKRNLTKKQMETKLKEFAKKSTLKTSDIAVVIIMSHGTNRDTLGGYTEIFGSDDQALNVDNILKLFTNKNCPYMKDKPKIFIFQCCRGTEAFIKTDANPLVIQSPGLDKDMLIAYSTLPGFASHRDPTTGTWYIQTICDVFSQHAHNQPVEELLKIVNDKLSRIHSSIVQTSTYENRGFKKCYLHPVVSTKKK